MGEFVRIVCDLHFSSSSSPSRDRELRSALLSRFLLYMIEDTLLHVPRFILPWSRTSPVLAPRFILPSKTMVGVRMCVCTRVRPCSSVLDTFRRSPASFFLLSSGGRVTPSLSLHKRNRPVRLPSKNCTFLRLLQLQHTYVTTPCASFAFLCRFVVSPSFSSPRSPWLQLRTHFCFRNYFSVSSTRWRQSYIHVGFYSFGLLFRKSAKLRLRPVRSSRSSIESSRWRN